MPAEPGTCVKLLRYFRGGLAARDHTFATFPLVTDDDVAAILKFILEGGDFYL